MLRQHWAILILTLALVVGLLATLSLSDGLASAQDGRQPSPSRPRPGLGKVTNPEEEKAVRNANSAFTDAYNKGDLEGLMALWTEDGEFIHESGKVYRGKAAVRELLKKSLATNKGSKQTTRVESLRFIRPDVVVEDGVVSLTSADGNTVNGRYSTIWVKQDGKWLLSQIRDLPELEDSETPVATARLRQLAWMVGNWHDKDEARGITLECKWGPNQTYLLLEFTQKRPEGPPAFISQRIGWDPVNEQIRSWLFESGGGYAQGMWTRDGNSWIVESEGVYADGRQATSLDTWSFINNDSFTWSGSNRQVEEEPLPDISVNFVRKDKTR